MRAIRFIVLSHLMLGCAQDPYRFDWGLDEASTPVSDLSDEQAIDLCVSMVDHYDGLGGHNTLGRAVCLALAVGEEETEAACTTARSECERTAVFDHTTAPALCARNVTQIRTGCTATVAEVDQCVSDTAARLAAILTQGTCADAPSVTIPPGSSVPEGGLYDTSSPPSCLRLDAWCSELVLQSSRE